MSSINLNNIEQLRIALKQYPNIIKNALIPILKEKFQTYFKKILTDPYFETWINDINNLNAELLKTKNDAKRMKLSKMIETEEKNRDASLNDTITNQFETWIQDKDFFIRRTKEIEDVYPNLMKLWEDYSKSYFYVMSSVRNYDITAYDEIQPKLQRPTLLTFIKQLYTRVMQCIILNINDIYTSNEELMLEKCITKSIHYVIQNLLSIKTLFDNLNQLDEVQQKINQNKNQNKNDEEDQEDQEEEKENGDEQEEENENDEQEEENEKTKDHELSIDTRELPMDILVDIIAKKKQQCDNKSSCNNNEKATKKIIIGEEHPSVPKDLVVEEDEFVENE